MRAQVRAGQYCYVELPLAEFSLLGRIYFVRSETPETLSLWAFEANSAKLPSLGFPSPFAAAQSCPEADCCRRLLR